MFIYIYIHAQIQVNVSCPERSRLIDKALDFWSGVLDCLVEPLEQTRAQVETHHSHTSPSLSTHTPTHRDTHTQLHTHAHRWRHNAKESMPTNLSWMASMQS